MNRAIDSPYASLPTELVVMIVHEALVDFECARIISQVCSWMRQVALSRLYTTISRLPHKKCAAEFPHHLRQLVYNLWLDEVSPSDKSILETAWLWLTVPNLVIPFQFLSESCYLAHRDSIQLSPVRCHRLTTFGSELRVAEHLDVSVLKHITHLRLVQIYMDIPHIRLLLRMPSLQRVAVPVNRTNSQNQAACSMSLLIHSGVQMVVLVVSEQQGPSYWSSRVRAAMLVNQRLYMVSGADDRNGVHKE
ncbi:hypothetical protein AcV5_009934 [Taiwanofungus camphoratus]|nr:hypothetical protein AcV5_009934 [Antrodia cinnamomea]